MRIGVAFPTTEIGNDPADIRAFAREVEATGYDYITCIDHVVQGAEPAAHDWRAYYTLDNAFHEVLTLFGFLAGVTERVELATAILILPQRPTVLVAKQLAELDVLSGGRIRAGVGIGWNALEFDALGQDFRRRARRIEEQMVLLRRLWTEERVTFEGEFDRLHDAGINPRPVQRPIPLWIGAFQAPAIARAGRLADGLLLNPRLVPGDECDAALRVYREAAEGAGRDPRALGLDVTLFTEGRGGNALREAFEAWMPYAPTHVTVRTMGAGHAAVSEHLKALEDARAALG